MSDDFYCVVEDGDGGRWICPLLKKEEVESNLEAIQEYWRVGDYEEDCPEDLTELLNLPKWEGETLSFRNPCFDGEPV